MPNNNLFNYERDAPLPDADGTLTFHDLNLYGRGAFNSSNPDPFGPGIPRVAAMDNARTGAVLTGLVSIITGGTSGTRISHVSQYVGTIAYYCDRYTSGGAPIALTPANWKLKANCIWFHP